MAFCDTESKVSVKPKKRGRPATGRDPLVNVRLPKELIRKIEVWARDYPGMDRSAAIRCLIGLGLRTPLSKRGNVEDPRDRERHLRLNFPHGKSISD
jgi:hypothetical protein